MQRTFSGGKGAFYLPELKVYLSREWSLAEKLVLCYYQSNAPKCNEKNSHKNDAFREICTYQTGTKRVWVTPSSRKRCPSKHCENGTLKCLEIKEMFQFEDLNCFLFIIPIKHYHAL